MPTHQPNPECKRLLNHLANLAQQSGQDPIWLADGSLCIGIAPQAGELYSTNYVFHPGPQEVRCDKVCIPTQTPGRAQTTHHTTYDLPLTTEGLRRAWTITQRRLKRSTHVATSR